MSTQLLKPQNATTRVINLEADAAEKVVEHLNVLLADYHLHYQRLRNFHWNVSGNDFFTLHEQFEKLYNSAFETIDDMAERVLSLGYHPLSTMSEFIETSDLEEIREVLPAQEMVRALLDDYSKITENKRKLIEVATEAGDEGTADMITGFLENMEKNAWMLNAYLNQ